MEELSAEDTTGNITQDMLINDNIILDIEENIVRKDNSQQVRRSNRRRQPRWYTEYDVRGCQV